MAKRNIISFAQKSWRWLRLSLLTFLAFSLVVACGGNNSQQSSSETSASPTADCRWVEHAMGETCVPLNPQWVVVLDYSALDAALALGVKPVGMMNSKFPLSYSEKQLADIKQVGDHNQPNLETILRLDPDLILDCGRKNRQRYERLSQIGPTVSLIALDDCGFQWKEGFQVYAEALGKIEEGKELLRDYQQRIREFQTQMGARLKETEVSLVAAAPQYVRVYLEDSFMGSVIEETGLSRPPEQDQEGFPQEISLEKLSIADGDVMFLMEQDPEDSMLPKFLQSPLWSQLNVVKQEKVYRVLHSTWVAERSIGGANRILDDLFKYLVEERE